MSHGIFDEYDDSVEFDQDDVFEITTPTYISCACANVALTRRFYAASTEHDLFEEAVAQSRSACGSKQYPLFCASHWKIEPEAVSLSVDDGFGRVSNEVHEPLFLKQRNLLHFSGFSLVSGVASSVGGLIGVVGGLVSDQPIPPTAQFTA
jgi:hypothetical protein